MADILILTASFGMGHKSVANALKEQIEAEYKHVKVSVGDILEIVNPKVKKISTHRPGNRKCWIYQEEQNRYRDKRPWSFALYNGL